MKFIRTFAGGRVTAFLILGDELSVRWRGQPTKSILPEYGEWMRDCAQTYADSTGKRIVYLAPGSANELMAITPRKTQEARNITVNPPHDPKN